MSEFIKSYLQAKKNYKNRKIISKTKYKPAEKNINFAYSDSISYNLIDNMTMFKNNEINKSTLNQLLFSNLSLFFSKGKIDQKKIKKSKNKNDADNKKCSIQNYGIYFPTKRVTCLKEIKIYNKDDDYTSDKLKKYKKGNYLKIPFSYEHFKTFYPLGRNFLNFKYNDINKEKGKFNDSTTYDYPLKEKNSKNTSFYDNDNSASLISEESILSNQDLIAINNKESFENNNKSTFRNLRRFRKYSQLKDYIECPLKRKESIKEECDNFINLLNNFDDIIENNNDIEENIIFNENFDNNEQKVIIDDLQINNSSNNINIEQIKTKNNLILKIYDDKNYKSVNESKYINNISNSTIKNDFRETMDKTASSLNPNKSQLINNKIDKDKEISASLRKKYKKRMNDQYISLIHNIYKEFISKCTLAKSYYLDDIIIKKFFIQIFKTFLLKIGIINKKIYEKILKNQIYSNKLLSFDQFIQCFDSIICDNENENLKAKFSFLLYILRHENENDFLNSKDIQLFFELLGCNSVYIEDFCENLGDRLVARFNVIYQKDEKENILMGKYRFKKMKLVLESFFDDIQIND